MKHNYALCLSEQRAVTIEHYDTLIAAQTNGEEALRDPTESWTDYEVWISRDNELIELVANHYARDTAP